VSKCMTNFIYKKVSNFQDCVYRANALHECMDIIRFNFQVDQGGTRAWPFDSNHTGIRWQGNYSKLNKLLRLSRCLQLFQFCERHLCQNNKQGLIQSCYLQSCTIIITIPLLSCVQTKINLKFQIFCLFQKIVHEKKRNIETTSQYF